jgi:hypothetical protein
MLDGRDFSVVGVMPAGFQFPDAQTELWTPLALGGFILRARMAPIARLTDGASMESASVEINSILRHLTTTAASPGSALPQLELVGIQDQLVAPVRPALGVLGGAVGFVLLIACVNVTNLVLARTAARRSAQNMRRSWASCSARVLC